MTNPPGAMHPLPEKECGPHTGHVAVWTPGQLHDYAKAYAAPFIARAEQVEAARALNREKLIDLIAERLSGTYHCLRVWSAWNVGTMSQDDFEDVGESDTPAELAEAILTLLDTKETP